MNSIENSDINVMDENFQSKAKNFIEIAKIYLIGIYQKIYKNKKYEILAFIFLISALILYIIGLQGCVGDEVYCLSKLGNIFYYKLIIINTISSIFVSITFILMIFRKVYAYHLLYFIPLLLFLFNYDKGSNLEHHGYYNILGYIILLIIFLPITFCIYLIIILIKRKKYRIYIPILLFLFCLGIYLIIKIKININCENWDIGLNNTRIYNNVTEYACQINLPKSCYINILDGKLNATKILGIDCLKRDYKQKNVLFELLKYHKNPYINSKTKKIGFPILNKGNYDLNKQDGIPISYVMNNLVDMENLPPNLDKNHIPTSYIDFNDYPEDPDSKYGKIHFNLKKNETLIEERKRLAEKNEVIFNNIITIFLDTLSRAHFNRKMVKLKAWLEKFMKYPSKDFINYQFLKFHSLGPHTPINMKPAFFGQSILSEKGVSLVKYLHEKGFITSQADNYCNSEPYNVFQSYNVSKWTCEYFDHELISMFCDPNYYRPQAPTLLKKGYNSIVRRCLYGHDSYEYVLNYTKLFWKTYAGNRRFSRMVIMDSHEASGEVISMFDEPFTNFLNELYNNGDLNDTIIFMFSDHGNHMSPLLTLLPADDLEIEKIMPFFFIMIPKINENYNNKNLKEEYYQNLYKNQQSFVNCYDIYDTIIQIVFNDIEKSKEFFSPNGTSLFMRIKDKNRTCEDFPEILSEKSPGTLTCNCINNKNIIN